MPLEGALRMARVQRSVKPLQGLDPALARLLRDSTGDG